MTDGDHLATYQEQVVQHSGQRILLGGRQIGKTEAVIHDALDTAHTGQDAMIIVPGQTMAEMMMDRFRDIAADDDGVQVGNTRRILVGHEANIKVKSAYGLTLNDIEGGSFGRYSPSALCIDEANRVSGELLYEIESEYEGDVLLTATPRLDRSPVECWAKWSPYWQTWQVGQERAPHIQEHTLDDFATALGGDVERAEVHGEII